MIQTRATRLKRLLDSGLVAIVRLPSEQGVVETCKALADGGIVAMEITMTTPGALKAIEMARTALGDRIMVGVGSVIDAGTARDAISAGSEFVVSPVYRPSVVEAAHQADLPVLAGALTPGEILDAWEGGADVVKVFPANHFGPRYFKDVLAPMPQLRLTPTGGVNLDTIAAWFEVGAACLGVGSSMVKKDLVANKDWAGLTSVAKAFVDGVAAARSSK